MTLAQVLEVWKEPTEIEEGEDPQSAHDILGPISNFASDGDPNRCRAQLDLTSYFDTIDFDEPKVLVACALIDHGVGAGGIVQCYDLKHLFKRLRERLKSLTTGCKIGDGAAIQRSILQDLLRMHQPDLALTSLFDPLDR